MRHLLPLLLTILPALAPAAHAADWRPVERLDPYTVTGATGIALYRSIGERGPEVGGSRTIAHTRFDLTWTRDYRPQADGSCVLAVARPHLVITYTVPKAPAGIAPAVKASWDRFIAGMKEHERVHGRAIVDMVEKITAFSTGLTAADDPNCQKVRAALQKRLGEFIGEHRRQSQDFDREEMSEGGNVQQLILALVNGP
jgi:predicted secreted Zn-dependent protease